ncbi:hypothetical protein UY3_07954 [Chelonia mydas]|uniref:Uncharacterized protein n=1 Tax=Chelonia mydas TaxID=8469 RepID=M7BH29_CHEMY|nr:hypothetical protein UY3_07954 [Chelonia mydas]
MVALDPDLGFKAIFPPVIEEPRVPVNKAQMGYSCRMESLEHLPRFRDGLRDSLESLTGRSQTSNFAAIIWTLQVTTLHFDTHGHKY